LLCGQKSRTVPIADIFSEWLPSSGYEKSMDYDIQVYGPGNTQSDDYKCGIWISIKKITR
jgi:AraC family transcriptional regulator